MTATGFPLMAWNVLAQTTGAPFPMPQTYGEGLLIFGLVVAVGAGWRVQEARVKRAEGQVDALTSSLPELLLLMREWKEANRGRTPTNGS